MTQRKFSLTAAQLRVLALGLMLVDHVGRTQLPDQLWMVCLGRMAFPIFAFQIAEGYHHTRDFRGYCKRLALFALVSEIPFDLMVGGTVFYPAHQNVMFTLLMGLWACQAWDRQEWWKLIVCWLLGSLGFTDYGALGVATVLVFHVFRGHRIVQLLLLANINCLGYGWFSIQSFGVLAWVPLCLYRGEKGRGGKWLQYGSYIFYPAHMLILGLL